MKGLTGLTLLAPALMLACLMGGVIGMLAHCIVNHVQILLLNYLRYPEDLMFWIMVESAGVIFLFCCCVLLCHRVICRDLAVPLA